MQLQKRRIKKQADLPEALIGATITIGHYTYKVIAGEEYNLPVPTGAYALAKETMDRVSDVVEEAPQKAPASKPPQPTS